MTLHDRPGGGLKAFDLRRSPHRASTITQMCREFGVTARALRFYESQGLLSPARRQQARIYGHKDRVRLQLILSGRKAGISLRQVRELFDLYDKEGIVAQSAKALPLMQERIEALTQTLAEIDGALEALRTASAHFEARLEGAPATH